MRRIFDTTLAVIATAERDGITTAEAAERLAEDRIAEIGRVRLIRTFIPRPPTGLVTNPVDPPPNPPGGGARPIWTR